MRPVKFTTETKQSAHGTTNVLTAVHEGFLHAILPGTDEGPVAVVEYVKSGKVVIVRAENIQFEPTTETLYRQQQQREREQQAMMARMGGIGGSPLVIPG